MSFSMVVLWLIVVYCAVGEPFLGVRMYRRLMSGRMTRMSFYRKIVLMVFGAVLMFGYAQIGTLWILIIIHTIIDLRALLFSANSSAEIPNGT